MPNKCFRKVLVVGIILLFILAGVITSTGINIGIEKPSKTITMAPMNTLLPPLMWTEDFSTFYIKIPNEPCGDDVYYFIDWGDGIEEWIGPYESNDTISISHIWDEGNYQIKIKVKNQNCESKYTTYSIVLSSDFNFFGVVIGYVDITYTFTFCWRGADYYILIYWDDGNITDWLGPYESNESIVFSHSWSRPGEYIWKIRFKDIHGQQSPWIEIIIKIMPLKNKSLVKSSIKGKQPVKPLTYDYKFKATNPDEDYNEEDCIECQSNGSLCILYLFLRTRGYFVLLRLEYYAAVLCVMGLYGLLDIFVDHVIYPQYEKLWHYEEKLVEYDCGVPPLPI